jgi:hypothetical protein
MRLLKFWHHVHTARPGSLLLQFAQSWPRNNIWEQRAHQLLRAYHIDLTTALVTSRKQFATITRVCIQFDLEHTRERNTGSTHQGYRTHFLVMAADADPTTP